MGVNQFEDLVAWQKARQLTKQIYQLTRKANFARDFGLAGQIQRASVSIMSNIAEGYERSNPNELHQLLVIAKGSCGEVRSELYVAFDNDYISREEFKQILAQTNEVHRNCWRLASFS